MDEVMLASYLSPDTASTLKAPTLPTKPCRTTSGLVGKAYMEASRAGASLHTMAIMQVYQADLLRDFDKGKGVGSEDIKVLRRSTDLGPPRRWPKPSAAP